MNLSKKERTNISKKNQQLEDIKPILKKEFIGIDNVIEQIVDSIRPYYIFPKSLKRPLVVNLFGMTGTGKSHLAERIIELLNLKHKYFRFDVGDYAKETSDWKLKNDLSNDVKKTDEKDLVLIFDEFQFGRTIDEKGLEVDRSSLRPMWELIDSGIIAVSSYSGFSRTFDVYDKLKKCLRNGVKIENGIVIDNIEVYRSIMLGTNSPASTRPCDYETLGNIIIDGKQKKLDPDDECWYTFKNESFKNPYFIGLETFHTLYNSNPDFFDNIKNFSKWKPYFTKGKIEDLLISIYENFIMSSPLMKKNDYSQSLIFVIGNIDEAYTMSHSSDPDADADIFYEYSQKITVPKMKNALSNRFRMEQIGRLGNNIVIYPALSSNSYKLIIEKHLNIRTDYFKSEFGLNLKFTDNLKDIVYKESVFPTQGVRPILSTFNTFIDSYVSKLVSDLILKMSEAKELTWDFDLESSNHIFTIKEKKDIFELKYPVKLHIEKLRRSDQSENQLYTAVHEAGHAITALVKLQLIPKMVTSKTASIAEGFCRTEFPEIRTKNMMYGEIVYALGGREAEMAIFGEDNLSNGAGSDLTSATTIAVQMVKIYGMGEHSFQIQNGNTQSAGIFSNEWSKDAELQAINNFKKAQKESRNIINKHLDKVIELSEYLTINSKIEYADLKDMVNRWGLKYKDKEDYFHFKDMLQKKKTETLNCKKSIKSIRINSVQKKRSMAKK